ncbi:MAG: FAD:protein FMN transferase [Spirochaetaceae bacterium]|jgi:thiamine biosynthesis lipoprotein|nr:FAD:protein FMN transferase [Spirochaetaceae bacterium]
MKIGKVLLYFCTLSFLLSGCARSALPARTELVLGTVCTVNLFEDGTQERYNRIFLRLRELEETLSAHLSDSEIAFVNDGAGLRTGAESSTEAGLRTEAEPSSAEGILPVSVSEDTLYVIALAKEFAELTGGKFDPTIGPLVRLWDVTNEFPRVPSSDEIAEALALVDYRLLEIDEQKSTLYLPVKGMKLDAGGIAKGYAADEIVRILKEEQVRRALIDLGGNIYAFGERERNTPWRIGIRDPFQVLNEPVIRINVTNQSVVTSGVYERFFEQDGVRYHHILDPETGYPVRNNIMSVTIVTGSSTTADALSTSLFLLGVEEGLRFVESLPGTEAVFITDNRQVYHTKGLTGKMEILSGDLSSAP